MSDLNLGDEVYTNNIFNNGGVPSTATIIGKPVAITGQILIGWKRKAAITSSSPWPINCGNADAFGDLNKISNWDEFEKGYWVSDNRLKVVTKSANLSKTHSPVQCARCQDKDFPYAEPNQPDGSFICWSCSKYPFYK